MLYSKIKKAVFLDRPNRFIANIELDGEKLQAHVKNTGRCKELLIPGATVYVQEKDIACRKTKYDLITVKKGDRLVNIDSQAPNKVVLEWIKDGNFLPDITKIQSEYTLKGSRIDFFVEYQGKKALIEVKGVTLEQDGVALFPDAPTDRGVKHIKELILAQNSGFEAYIIFLIQLKGVSYFSPNANTHKEFAEELKKAHQSGVIIIALDSIVTKDSITAGDRVEIRL